MILAIVGATTKSGSVTELVMTLFYLLNPMFTFYLTNYLIVMKYINTLIPDTDPKLYIPLSFGLQATTRNSLVAFAF